MASFVRRKGWVPSLLLLGLLAGCGSPENPPSAAAPTAARPALAAAPGDRLYIRDGLAGADERLTIIDSVSGASERSLPPGVSSPDWSTLYVATPAAGKTRVEAIELSTGKILRSATLDGSYELPMITPDSIMGGLSPNGRWLALVAQPQAGARQTSFLVLDTAFEGQPKPAELAGDFAFDGLNNAGTSLFLTESLAADPAAKYQVRRFDLARGALDPNVIVEKGEEDEPMSGVRQSAVASRAGDWLYSLYLNHDDGPFIHALPVDGQFGQFAFCIDLPATGKGDRARQARWSLVMSANNRLLYAVNGALGLVVEYDLSNGVPQARRTSTLFDAPAQAGATAAPGASTITALAPDGALLFTLGERGLLAIDAKALTLRGRYLDDWALDGLAISADGLRLYAASAAVGKIVRLDPRAGTIVAEVPAAGKPAGVVRVES